MSLVNGHMIGTDVVRFPVAHDRVHKMLGVAVPSLLGCQPLKHCFELESQAMKLHLFIFHLLSKRLCYGSKEPMKAPFASLKKQAEILFRLICCERKILFRLKNKLKKTDYKRSKHSLLAKGK